MNSEYALRPYNGEEAHDPRMRGDFFHYSHEAARLTGLLQKPGLSQKERGHLEQQMNRALEELRKTRA